MKRGSGKTYAPKKPCIRGHMERRVSNGLCVECSREKSRRYVRANPEKRKASVRQWRIANAARDRANTNIWAATNKEKRARSFAEYKRSHKQKVNANQAARRARKLAQVCKCCTVVEIESLYLACPSGHEVDHVLALALGGLHCRHNLQILSEAQHVEKTKNDLSLIAKFKRAA